MLRYCILLICSILCTVTVVAQTANERIYHLNPDKIKVFGKAGEQTMAWCGGVNNPQFAMADLNRDGKNDLVIFETGGIAKTFLYTGTPGTPKYRYAPRYASKFPSVSNYLKLMDFDGDNIPDLLHYGASNNGATVCKGYYNQDNQLCYDQCKDIRYKVPNTPGTVNIGIDYGFMPAYGDVDGDKDIDILVYSPTGSLIKWYKNFQVEDNLSKEDFRFDLVSTCWGKVEQKENYRTHNLSFQCNSSPKPEPNSQNKTTGGSHGICLLDGDGDGDLDVLDASSLGNDIQYLVNGRTVYGLDTMIAQDTMWQSGKKVLTIKSYPVAYWVDIDNDNDRDILISPFMANAENYRCIHYYSNDGSDAAPNFVFKTDTLFLDDMIDVGERAFPAIYDYDKDGKPDMFAGGAGYFPQSGPRQSRISYFKNVTNLGQSSFSAETTDFLNLSGLNLPYLYPAFGDLDGDKKDDMVLGKADGTLLFYQNQAATNNDVPNWVLQIGNLRAGSIDISVGGSAAPFIYDFNKDGHNDLIIGGQNGKFAYYQNLGTPMPGKPALRLITDALGNVKVDDPLSTSGYSVPYIGKIDNSGQEYLLAGSQSGSVYRYKFQHGNTTTPFTLIESDYSQTKVANASGYAAPTVFDIDGDGKYEMIIGTVYGGLMLYEQMFATDIPEVNNTARQLDLYPNPAQNELTISLPEKLKSTGATINTYNSIGQAVHIPVVSSEQGIMRLDISKLPVGVYMCTLISDGQFYSTRFIKK